MSWPDIQFSSEEKVKFQKMAIELELRIDADSMRYKDLERFSQYPPFVEALRLAKEKKLDAPFIVPNTNYWYFETDLQDWMRAEGTGMLSRFLSAIEGWQEQSGADSQLNLKPPK